MAYLTPSVGELATTTAERPATGAAGVWPLFIPNGAGTGFVTVTLSYTLPHHGVGVAMTSTIVGLHFLPTCLRFVAGPLIDRWLSPPLWSGLFFGLTALCLAGFAVTPLEARTSALVLVLALILGIAVAISATGSIAFIAQIVPPDKRGAAAGWAEAGNLVGVGFGGGLALWISNHAGGIPAAAVLLAVLCLMGLGWLFHLSHSARQAGDAFEHRGAEIASALTRLIRTRDGVLTLFAVVLPLAVGAVGRVLPAVAGEWQVSADQVALVSGLLNGGVMALGCVVGAISAIGLAHCGSIFLRVSDVPWGSWLWPQRLATLKPSSGLS